MGDLTIASCTPSAVDSSSDSDRSDCDSPPATLASSWALLETRAGVTGSAGTAVAVLVRILTLRPSCSISSSERLCSRTRSSICLSWSRSTSSDLHEFRCGLRQHLDSGVGHEHIVLNSHASPARKIRSRLDRKHHAHGHGFFLRVAAGPASRDPGILMDLDSEAMASAVAKGLPETPPRQLIASGRIDVEPRSPWPDRLDRQVVRRPDGRVDLSSSRICHPDRYGPGEVD